MSVEENKAIVRMWADGIIDRDPAGLDNLMTSELAQEWKQTIQWIDATFDGHHIELTELIGDGDRVWLRLATGGDHMGDHTGNRHTGEPWKNQAIYFCRVAEGRIVAVEGFFDTPKTA